MQTIFRLTRAFVAAVLLAAPGLAAQQVTGRVMDQRSGQPLAAVQVFIAGSGIGALSQQNGRYLLVTAAVLAEAEAIFPACVALKVDPDAPAGDDPYADPQYRVPDDLVW